MLFLFLSFHFHFGCKFFLICNEILMYLWYYIISMMMMMNNLIVFICCWLYIVVCILIINFNWIAFLPYIVWFYQLWFVHHLNSMRLNKVYYSDIGIASRSMGLSKCPLYCKLAKIHIFSIYYHIFSGHGREDETEMTNQYDAKDKIKQTNRTKKNRKKNQLCSIRGGKIDAKW